MSEKVFSEFEVTLSTALELGLTEEEYKSILNMLGRTPSYTELGIFGVMWSEHCSYKNSILQLKTLPRSGGRLLVEAGQENAGLVYLGDDESGNKWAIAFKIESHNHPSAIEPFQGAATGVGGILRDIFTMGARPIAVLDSLRFGDLDTERTKYLLRGVVSGISHYGNSFGVPTVGGEIYFDRCYQDNPLVNVMAVGVVRVDKTASASAKGVGNPVMIIGSSTGRDGIHGASLLASREFDDKTDDMRPTVQVGDPFAEKLLLEATLEMIEAGVIAGIQDMGAAGISCSTSEMSAKAGTGMEIDLDKVPLRESDMSAYEIMLSESQERMLAVIKKGMEEKAYQICRKWDVPINQIGEVTNDGLLKIHRSGKKVAEIVANHLVLGGGAPQYVRESKEPEYLSKVKNIDIEEIIKDDNPSEAFFKLLSSPTIASKRWVYQQYDSQVRTNTISIKGDAAVLRIKELPGKGIAITTDCNSRYTYLNPYVGGMIAVLESARNVVCVGAKPVAITDCLNFGNPYDPEIYWQFKEAIRGIGEACRAIDTPVTGGNVSFHNESQNFAVFPTPVIGMLGIIDDLSKVCSAGFKNSGDFILLLGNMRGELGGSEYLKVMHNTIAGECPIINIDEEKNLQNLLLDLIDKRYINSAHDVSEGGIAICLAEKAIFSEKNLGCVINNPELNNIAKLFGESQSRIIVSISENKFNEVLSLSDQYRISCIKIGEVVEKEFKINDIIKTHIDELRSIYESAIPELLKRK